MPITESCIAKKEDLENWLHLRDIELRQLDITSVMLIVGLKENPSLFLSLECRASGKREPVAIRYSLGWTVIGPVGGESCTAERSVNYLHMEDSSAVCGGGLDFEDYVLCKDHKKRVVLSKGLNSEDAYEENVADMNCVLELQCNLNEPKHCLQIDEIDRQARDDELSQQLERLWRTDFENSKVETRVVRRRKTKGP